MNTVNQRPLWRSLLRTFLLIGGIWLSVQWLLYPGYLLLNTPPLPQVQKNAALPSEETQQQLKRYYHIRKISPVLRPLVSSYVATILTHHVHPARIERSFRQVLLQEKFSAWFTLFEQWESLLREWEHMFPQFHLEAYRAYLYLHAGHLERLRQWGTQLSATTPQQRQLLLLHIWIGHACFLGGWPQQAESHYRRVEQAFDQNPSWDRRTTHNWRLPAERSTVLYHLGLLALRRQQPQQALTYFRQLAKRWQIIDNQTHTLPLWYLSHLWSVVACEKISDPSCIQQHMQQAVTFAPDPTLGLLTQASLPSSSSPTPSRVSPNAVLGQVIATSRNHSHSYGDSPQLARLLLGLRLLKVNEVSRAYTHLDAVYHTMQKRSWPSTLGMLQRRHTERIRYLPWAPALYTQLIRALEVSVVVERNSAPQQRVVHVLSQPTSQRHTLTSKKATSLPVHADNKKNQWLQQKYQLLREFRMYRALSYLKMYAWEEAQSHLQKMVSLYPGFAAPVLYLGLLALEQKQYQQAYLHFKRYHHSTPSSTSVLYAAYAAIQSGSSDAAQWLIETKKYPISQSQWQFLQRLLQRKPHHVPIEKAQFWWRVLGAEGLLAVYDPNLERKTKYWQIRDLFFQTERPKQFFRSLRVSHWISRHSLSSWLARYRYLALLYPQQKTEYLRRLDYIQSYYRNFPHQWYLLDRTMYSHHWGLMALGLF